VSKVILYLNAPPPHTKDASTKETYAICLKNLVIYNGKALFQWALDNVWGHAHQIKVALGEHALPHY
jgi:hypothetical protein